MLTTSREKFDEAMDTTEEELGTIDPEKRDRVFEVMKDPSKYTINVDRSTGLGALRISKGMAKIFYGMGWSLLKPEDKSEFFITSDHPVTRIVPEVPNSFFGDGGFMNRNVQVTFPLSPDRLLIMTWGPDVLCETIPIQRRLVHAQNKQRAFFAEAQIYADRRNSGIQTLVKKYKRFVTIGEPLDGVTLRPAS